MWWPAGTYEGRLLADGSRLELVQAGAPPELAGGPIDDFIDEIKSERWREIVRLPADVLAELIDSLARTWAKITGLPRFAIVAYVLYRVTASDFTDDRRRR